MNDAKGFTHANKYIIYNIYKCRELYIPFLSYMMLHQPIPDYLAKELTSSRNIHSGNWRSERYTHDKTTNSAPRKHKVSTFD